jgi:hypothetical protein
MEPSAMAPGIGDESRPRGIHRPRRGRERGTAAAAAGTRHDGTPLDGAPWYGMSRYGTSRYGTQYDGTRRRSAQKGTGR